MPELFQSTADSTRRPLPYATPEDVARLLDDPPDQLTDDYRPIYARRVRFASQKWDRTTGAPMRAIRTGSPDRVETWETHDVRDARGPPPVRVDLDHGDILPINPDAGDTIEVRDGRDSWDDVTDEGGDTWVLDYDTGELKIFRFLIRRLLFEEPSQRFVRLTYRHGGLGGDYDRGATTELTDGITASDETVSVANASVFPQPPFEALVGVTGETAEYVTVYDVNPTTGQLSIERGQQFTEAQDWQARATVNYAPEDVREAVAAKATEQVIMNDDADLAVPDNGNLSSRAERASTLSDEWDETVANYAGVRTL